MYNGFIIDSGWEENSAQGNVILYVRCEDEVFTLRFTDQKFTLFVEEDSPKFKNERIINLKAPNQKKVKALYTNNQREFMSLKEDLSLKGIRSYENDIWPHDRFLMERFIFGDIKFEAKAIEGKNLINPKIYPGIKSRVIFQSLSLDIETGVAGEVYSIGVCYFGKKELQRVYMLTDGFHCQDEVTKFYFSEKELIENFLKDFFIMNPDILIGWHVVGFDLKFLIERSYRLGINFDLSRSGKKMSFREGKGTNAYIDIPGRAIIDGPKAMKAMFLEFENLKLETVAHSVLKTSKDIASDSGKVSEIERRFKEDKLSLAKYNLLDCTLVKDIYEKLSVYEFYIEKTRNSGLLFNKSGISTLEFDFNYLPKFHRMGYVAQNASDFERDEQSSGGLVLEPVKGLHKKVAVFDFKSLYPSIIRTFKIDPLSLIEKDVHPVVLPNKMTFSTEKHILPAIIENLLYKREEAKVLKNGPLSQAIKILMNSFYGVMGTPKSRFYHSDLPSAITTTGHWIINKAIEFLNNIDVQVLYGDTDSIFFSLENSSYEENELVKKINEYFDFLIMDEFKVKSFLEIEHEKTFDQLFFSTTRDGLSGAKKKYAGIIHGKISFIGMEFVRSDWTDLAKKFQFELFEKFFNQFNLEIFIKEFVDDLKLGSFDNLLFYTKRLSKDISEYTKNIPVHVKAAQMIKHKGPYRLKEVSYAMTKSGAVPKELMPKDFDYDHYIEKQIKPLADQVLGHMNLDYETLFSGKQLDLF